MSYFKDLDNRVHEIDEDFSHLLPEGCVKISEAEAARLAAEFNKLSPRDQILQDIATLESSVTPRRLREAVYAEGAAWIQEIDQQIKELRAKL